MKVHGRIRGIPQLFHHLAQRLKPRRQMVKGGRRHVPASSTLRKTRYLLYRRLGGSQGRSGRLRNISPTRGLDPRTFQPVVSRYTD